jgi:NAD-dependent DNA ligase
MKNIEIPTICPSCGSILQFFGPQLFCTNSSNCPAQNIKRVENFVSTMKIKGLGPKLLEKLSDELGLNSIIDIYKYNKEELCLVLGDTIGSKIYLEIQASKSKELSLFIQAIGIPMIGSSAAKIIAESINEFKDILNISDISKELGSVKFSNLLEFLNTKLCLDLIDLNLPLVNNKNKNTNKVKGYVCITGKLNNFKNRKDAETYLATFGWVNKPSVTKEVTYLICEDESKVGSSSYKKALQKQIAIITIEDLIKIP